MVTRREAIKLIENMLRCWAKRPKETHATMLALDALKERENSKVYTVEWKESDGGSSVVAIYYSKFLAEEHKRQFDTYDLTEVKEHDILEKCRDVF